MNTLKKLITLKNSSPQATSTDDINNKEENLSSYYDSGYSDSKSAQGAHLVFSECLDDNYEGFREKCRTDEIEQQKLNEPFIQALKEKETKLKGTSTLKSIKEDNLKALNERKRKISHDIANVKSSPEDYGIDSIRKPRAQFFIGLIILLPITLYLIVFYMSASYSAFFKVFNPNALGVADSIFDAQAFSKAWNEGVMEAIFIGALPFAFMGLGYLIHMFQKEKGSALKILMLFAVTFIFDAILAYLIEAKIYELTRTLNSPDFNLSVAFSSILFWGIIFAGFVVYIIWGLVFDFIMKEHEEMDKISSIIKKFKEEKDIAIQEEKDITEEINKLKVTEATIEGDIAELKSKINGFIFPKKKYLRVHNNYTKGWYMAIAAELCIPREKQDELMAQCKRIEVEHLERVGISEDSAESLIFTSTAHS